MPETPEQTKLQTTISDLAKQNEALNARLKEVGEKIGQINARKPTVTDRFKAAFQQKKDSPLAKLSDERDQIMESMRSNQRERDAAATKLDQLTKDAQAKVKAEGVTPSVPRTTVGDTWKKTNPSQKPSEVSVSGPQVNPPTVSQTDPLRSPLHSSAYAPALEPETPRVSQKQDPLRSPLQSSAYAPSLEPEIPRVSQQQDPLRSPLNSSAYAPALEPETPRVSQKQDPLRSPLNSSAYAPALEPETPRVSQQNDPLRSGEPDPYNLVPDQSDPSYDVVEEVGNVSQGVRPQVKGPGTSQQSDPLRSGEPDPYNLVPPSDPSYDVVEEVRNVSQDVRPQVKGPSGSQQSDVLRSDEPDPYNLVPPSDPSYDVIGENGVLRKELAQDDLALGQEGPQVGEGAKFKMKPMLDRYVEGEKNSASKKVKVGGKDVEVHQKDWLLETVNEDRRKKGQAEMTKEQWDNGLGKIQATTQYFNDEQRKEHEVNLEGGVLKNGAENLKAGKHVFVMDGEGQVYAKENQATMKEVDQNGRLANVHHSSFLAGEEVAGAGELVIGGDGSLKEVTDRSGHYKPGEEQTKQTLESLDDRGVSLDNVKFTLDRGPKQSEKTGGMVREFLQGQVTPEEQQHRAERQAAGGSVSDTSKVMEQTFKGRHNVVDQIKAKGESVRDILRKTDNLKNAESRSQAKGVGKVL